MFRRFRATQEALSSIKDILLVLAQEADKARADVAELKALSVRLDELERSRAKWEAEMDAELLKAQGKYQAANNAEGRTQTTIKAYKKLIADVGDEGEEEDVEDQEWLDVARRNAEGSEAEGVLDLPLGVAPNAKAQRLKAKFS